MKKTFFAGLVFALLLGACLPFPSTPAPGPTSNIAETINAVVDSSVAQTLTAQPAPSLVPAPATSTPVLESPVPSATEVPLETPTPVPNLTTTPATATLGTLDQAVTPTLVSGQFTASPTLGILKYGTLPPDVPSSTIRLINKSKTEAYISLQVTLSDGRYSIIEYPVRKNVTIRAPLGAYVYVAWVGGNKMVGDFRLSKYQILSITLYRDKVLVE